MVVAIDGPAASGKSSVARKLARSLGFSYVNSGAMYRAVTWELLREQIDPARPDRVEAALGRMKLDSGFSENGDSYIRINAEIPDLELRQIEVNQAVSAYSAIPAVRNLIGQRLRSMCQGLDVVMEGRDIGTAVFPDSPHKFYLDASPEIRRRRRAAQGQDDSIEHRDKLDSTRRVAPLSVASDAHVIDTSHLDIEGVVGHIAGILKGSGIPAE
ncbi:MAG: (d)CMP kinase [Verrucomicrobia bacterium]|jgi:cytidylate kinase|nr:(d)CMP kinase [Verrucomicrobiota bacterium]